MVVQPLLTLTSQAMIAGLIIAALIWFDPQVALVAAVLIGGGYALIFRILKHQLEVHGTAVWRTGNTKQRLLTESLGGIKEIKLAGTEHVYEERLDEVSSVGLRSGSVVDLLGDLPRFVLEPMAFCALLSLGIYMLLQRDTAQHIVGVLSLYAMAGYRLLPAAQSVFKTSSQIRANGGVVEELLVDVRAGRAVPKRSVAPVTPLPSGDIHLENVWFEYPDTSGPVVKGLSLDVPRSAIAVLVGPSGAGKSTVADLLLGLLRPTKGTIRVGDRDIADSLRSWQATLGYVPQNIFLLDDTIAANISFGSAHEIDMQKVRRAAEMAHIAPFIESLPGQYEYVVGERGALLSGGQKQRIGIARALYHDADVLVLDEATSALDTMTERDIIATLAELKRTKTIVMIAHRLSTIKAADYIVLMRNGELQCAGSFDDLMKRSREFRDLVAAGSDERAVHTA
jgi:HlyD family secretion protein